MAKSMNDSRIMEQKDTISQLNMVVSSQNELIASLRGTVEECNATISSLREQVEYLTRKLFGTSSERSKAVAGQLNLFDEAEQEAQLPEEEAATEAVVKEHARRAKRTNDEAFKGVPSRDEVISLSDGQRRCADCGSEMEVIGKESVRQEEIAKISLNGAQISSILEIVRAVGAGEMEQDSAITLLTTAFPFEEQEARRILGNPKALAAKGGEENESRNPSG